MIQLCKSESVRQPLPQHIVSDLQINWVKVAEGDHDSFKFTDLDDDIRAEAQDFYQMKGYKPEDRERYFKADPARRATGIESSVSGLLETEDCFLTVQQGEAVFIGFRCSGPPEQQEQVVKAIVRASSGELCRPDPSQPVYDLAQGTPLGEIEGVLLITPEDCVRPRLFEPSNDRTAPPKLPLDELERRADSLEEECNEFPATWLGATIMVSGYNRADVEFWIPETEIGRDVRADLRQSWGTFDHKDFGCLPKCKKHRFAERFNDLASYVESLKSYGVDDADLLVNATTHSSEFHDPPLKADEAASNVQRFKERKPQNRLHRISSSQLSACDSQLEYHVPGFLVAGQPCILAGGKKNLKTGLAVALSVALASKEPFLGHFPVAKACRVGLFSGESGDFTLRETAQRICRSQNLSLRDLDNLVWCFDLPKFNNQTDLQFLREFIEQDELKAVILDPVYLCLGAEIEAGNLFAVGEMMSRIGEIGKATGCTIILAHHTRKNLTNPYQPAELEDIAWAGFQEFARQWILLSRREPYDPDSGGLHKLWVNAGGSAGHSGLWGIDIDERRDEDTEKRGWKVNVVSAAKARVEAESMIACRQRDKIALRQQVTWSRNEQLIMRAMENRDWMSQRMIKTAARMSGDTVRPIVVEMAKKGVIEERSGKLGHSEYRYPVGGNE